MSGEQSGEDLSIMKQALDSAGVSVMMVDRDLNITYANQSTISLISDNLATFQKAFPGINPSSLLGACIDQFHEDPSSQRKLLSNPKNLPYVTDIKVIDLTFQLNVTGIFNNEGEYIGNALEWSDVTSARAEKDRADNLFSSIQGSATPMMTCDRDFIVNYANPSTVKLAQDNLALFQSAFPGFTVEGLVGSCIDMFHKNPAHQRKLLDSVNNLPYQTDIVIGDKTFALNVSAMMNPAGEYIGNTLEWSDVSAARAEKIRADNLFSSIEGSATAMMTCDRDLVITYANPATIKMAQENLAIFKSVFPSFSIESLIGSCIDIFHVNPAHQRKLLSEVSNLPYQTDISVGELKFELNVSAMINPDGVYIGNSLEWSNVTEARIQETKAASLSSLVDSTMTNYMTIDMDRVITYCNPAVISLLGGYTAELRALFPTFDVNKLVGICIDDFHVNPAHQAAILGSTSSLPYSSEIKAGSLEFGLNAMALLNSDGVQIGAAVEWLDNNARARYRDEVNTLIVASENGDLGKRGNVESMDVVYKPMLEGINNIITAIVAPIDELKNCLGELSKGDLTSYVNGDYKGDHEALKLALNGSLDSLNDIMQQVNNNAQQISTGAGEVSSSSQAISQAATEQAASLEEITSSMNEMSSQTKANAENATQANQLSESAREAASAGSSLMKDMTGAMSEIEDSSKNISKIIKVIDEIAFQTNLLALNAAVEAARAGVHGKGFAVVAEEVRNLAARSANAAKETTELIEGSVSKVMAGTDIANKTSSSLEEIVGQVGKVTDLVAEIAAASNEQAEGILQVNTGLEQLDKVTQQNTASAEESASSSVELKNSGQALIDVLSRFTIKQPESSAGGANLSPEMLEVIKKMIASGQFALPGVGSPPPTQGYNGPEQRAIGNQAGGNIVKPDDIIPMGDDDGLGRY